MITRNRSKHVPIVLAHVFVKLIPNHIIQDVEHEAITDWTAFALAALLIYSTDDQRLLTVRHLRNSA